MQAEWPKRTSSCAADKARHGILATYAGAACARSAERPQPGSTSFKRDIRLLMIQREALPVLFPAKCQFAG
jgi:hypothetical protein